MNGEGNVLLILLGSILTFAGTWLVETLKGNHELYARKISFITFIKIEFTVIGKTLDKLKTALEQKRYYDFLLINRLNKILLDLDNTRRDSVVLNDQSQEENLLLLLSDLSIYLNDINGLENLYLAEKEKLVHKKNKLENNSIIGTLIFKTGKDLDEYIVQRRTEKLIELIEIQRRIDELLNVLKGTN